MTSASPNRYARLGLQAIAVQRGREYVTLTQLVAEKHLTADKSHLIRNNGTNGYHRSSDQTPQELAAGCVMALLENAEVKAAEIDLLVFTSTVFESTSLYPDLIALQVAKRCRCNSAKTFSVQHLYCVSPLAALQLVAAYFHADPKMHNAVIVCADTIGAATEHLRAIDVSGLHSDGASAILLQNGGPGQKFKDIEIFQDVAKYQGHNPDGTIINSALNFAIVAKLVRTVMNRNGLGRGDRIGLFPNNLDFHAWMGIAQILGIEDKHVHFNRHSGHMFGADPFLNLHASDKSQFDYHILAATGVAGTFGVALLGARGHA